MKVNQLTLWLMGALLLGMATLYGINAASASSRLDRIENKVDAIQAQYGRIADMNERMGRLERQIDQLQQQLR